MHNLKIIIIRTKKLTNIDTNNDNNIYLTDTIITNNSNKLSSLFVGKIYNIKGVCMLKLKNIVKQYTTGDITVNALDDVSITFRKSEFVSILGPSGCGKTTMLNIVGGLDRYSSGDLIINGKSTKEYKDKDWDTYRNHSIGFVFQSYNLIPHQTVLENVELALTLSGVSKEERRQRAIDVLTKVGLKDKLKNRPNQLSGGQMQRVAIARALVNDPEIILADEPTGALDTASSVQVMELLKEISKDKLIIMVTHNPELAQKYSTRIIKLLDGKVIDDSSPYDDEQEKATDTLNTDTVDNNDNATSSINKSTKKKRMSFFTALSLSLKNILTKKARTFLVSFAGSIGIIGIALVLAISSGFSTYINKMQEDTLSTYPISISSKSVDFSSVIESMFLKHNTDDKTDHDLDGVYPKENISGIINSVGSTTSANNLNKFYDYIQAHQTELNKYVNAIQYTYRLNLAYANNSGTEINPSQTMMQMIIQYALLFLENKTGATATQLPNGSYQITIAKDANGNDVTNYTFFDQYPELEYIKIALQNSGTCNISADKVIELSFRIIGVDMSGSSSGSSSFSFRGGNIFYEMLNNEELINSQYNLLGTNSKFPTESNEALLVLDKNNEVDDYALYALGLLSKSDMDNILNDLINNTKTNKKPIDYDSIIGKTYTVLDACDYYLTNEDGSLQLDTDGNPIDFRSYLKTNPVMYYTYYKQAVEKSPNKLTIVGIVRLNDTTDAGSLSTGIAYNYKFTQQMVNYRNNSAAAKSTLVTSVDKLSLNTPDSINIYVNTFEAKDKIKKFIQEYNDQAEKDDRITYTDYIDLIMSTVSVIINAITYVLIAFVSVSLIVSSIMIGIITYISVIERTKEIGVLRSVGASKRDVKRVFTAESFIIGLTSGLFGIIVSLILILPINLVLKHFTGLSGLASLPILGSVILVLISVTLTFIAGLIPANIAAKKDPVKALRTE